MNRYRMRAWIRERWLLLDADTRTFGAIVACACIVSAALIVIGLAATHQLCGLRIVKFC